MTDWRQEAENLTGDLERALEREKALQGKLDECDTELAKASELLRIAEDRIAELSSRLEECNALLDDYEARIKRLEGERDAFSSGLGSARELCREIEFFLRGHPGEASLLRAKIQKAIDREFVVEKPVSVCGYPCLFSNGQPLYCTLPLGHGGGHVHEFDPPLQLSE